MGKKQLFLSLCGSFLTGMLFSFCGVTLPAIMAQDAAVTPDATSQVEGTEGADSLGDSGQPLSMEKAPATEEMADAAITESDTESSSESATESTGDPAVVTVEPVASGGVDYSVSVTGIVDRNVQFTDVAIAEVWEDNEVQPSPVATDHEWLRRVYLDLVGHVPPAHEVVSFVESKSPTKRRDVIDRLLDDPAYVRNFTEVWTNILIGRQTPRFTSRNGMRKYLRESFSRNTLWNEMVYDLLTAEGEYEENGAVNFLLARMQMDDVNSDEYHVDATASTARIFLGTQVQCTQCHNHPFNEWKQSQFWEFNAFFRQSQKVGHRRQNPETGNQEDYSAELVYREFDGPVFYQNRGGLVQVAYPIYNGAEVDRTSQYRREELAKSICHVDADHQLARMMVNRMWGYFMGYGFTRPIDDMGPHNPVSHPEVLETLTQAFVDSGYDIKQLNRIICNTRSYNLTSKFGKGNEIDDPAGGEVALFSRMYVKQLQAEQVFDSLIVATSLAGNEGSGVGTVDERERWLNEFLDTFDGDEDTEVTAYNGSIPQSLLMMNGPLMTQAVSLEGNSFLTGVLSNPRLKSDNARVEALYLAAYGRPPERAEMNQVLRMMRSYPQPLFAYQDLFWALLNSNEFTVNH